VVQATSWEAEAASNKLQAIIIIGPTRQASSAKILKNIFPATHPYYMGKYEISQDTLCSKRVAQNGHINTCAAGIYVILSHIINLTKGEK